MSDKANLPGCYDVTFLQTYCNRQGGSDSEEKFQVTMRLDAKLPFVPTRDVSFGFEPHSDFMYDETKVECVMWHVRDHRFLVELETRRGNARQSAVAMAEEGWNVHLQVAHATKEDAEAARDPDNPKHVFGLNGAWYLINDAELYMLRVSGMTASKTDCSGDGPMEVQDYILPAEATKIRIYFGGWHWEIDAANESGSLYTEACWTHFDGEELTKEKAIEVAAEFAKEIGRTDLPIVVEE